MTREIAKAVTGPSFVRTSQLAVRSDFTASRFREKRFVDLLIVLYLFYLDDKGLNR